MGLLEILLIGVALSMDACAVAMTNGMTDRKMRVKKALLIGVFFGFFQALMPLLGYYITGFVASAFLGVFEKISAWVSFALLALLGGKMVVESVKEMREANARKTITGECMEDGTCLIPPKSAEKDALTLGKLFLQAVATSIDALAVGVTLQMAAISSEGLFLGAFGATAIIGVITLCLSVAAVYVGKAIGDKLTDKASLIGGLVLLAIGVKILIEGLL